MLNDKGVIVASDQNLEWLLPWWWERYSSCNSLPVVFFDLGMSLEKRAWCQERGEVISLSEVALEKPLSEPLSKLWPSYYGSSYFQARNAWFKKPSACFLSPFENTLWLDLDCEVLECLDGVFFYLQGDKEVAVALDSAFTVTSIKGLEKAITAGTVCNSGVIAFKKNSLIIEKWKHLSLSESEQYWGDDCLLSSVLADYQQRVSYLPAHYNWRISEGLPLNAKIIHWVGEWGKSCIAKNGGLKKAIEEAKGF